jgi:hypothetical protein
MCPRRPRPAARTGNRRRAPLYRRYGSNLPSSLTRILSNALEYSSRPPVSVCGTGGAQPHAAAFLEDTESPDPRPKTGPITPHPQAPRICLGGGPHAWPATTTARAGYPTLSLLRCPTTRRDPATTPSHPPKGAAGMPTVSTPRLGSDGHTPAGEYRLPHPFDYACRPRLRTRLTRGRRA